MKTDLKNSNKEHHYLMDRMKRLQKAQKRIAPRNKVRPDPLKQAKFQRKAKTVGGVTHRIDYKPHKDKTNEKHSLYQQKKEEIEMMGCTFNPSLDKNSMTMTMKNPKTPVVAREVPERYQRKLLDEKHQQRLQELEDEEVAAVKLPDYTGKKPNNEFFSKTVDWKNTVLKKRKQKQEENINNEISTMTGGPKINEKSKLLGTQKLGNEPFLKRVPKYIDQKKEKREILGKKYYDYPYKPQLNQQPQKN